MDEELKHNLTAGETWIRGLFILLFAFFLFIARIVTAAVVVIQFLFTVFTGQTNGNLRKFGIALSRYIYQCLMFLTYNSDIKPFPFEDWPESKELTEKGEHKEESAKAKTTAAPKKKVSKKARPKTTAKKSAKISTETTPKDDSAVGDETKPQTDADSPTGESETKPEA